MFPWRTGKRWSRFEYTYLAIVLVLGYLLLPAYFIRSARVPQLAGGHRARRDPAPVRGRERRRGCGTSCSSSARCSRCSSALRVLAGQRAAGRGVRVIPLGAGVPQVAPRLTIPFALLQGYIFARTRSLLYVVTVHLSFDLIIFAILVNAHTPQLFDVFVTAPR